ncbi:MAG TPA: hypothetical protein VMH26_04805 [Burkholderiales bacterium]|nr:hypothetical protein [Burkholderiales bacterium]
MEAEALLRDITDYCRRTGVAESTFGRLAVNDGKFVNRLRDGGRLTTTTFQRVRAYIGGGTALDGAAGRLSRLDRGVSAVAAPPNALGASSAPAAAKDNNFRFFDNRQKYLLFVHTCSEKAVVAERASMELANIRPRPPAVRVFDAGVGDGSVLTRVMRAMHSRFSTMPFYIVGKEISLEAVRLTLEKMPDRFCEHPATVLVMTNLYYREAPWLSPGSVPAATSLVWHELALDGTTAHQFEEQITALAPFLAENWRAHVSSTSGNPVYERPAVLVIYREDHRFLLDPIVPRRGGAAADYDLVIASQPYRARSPIEFKVSRVIAPLAKSLGPGGRLLAIHSHGNDPGLEILQGVWPGENPFRHDRHQMLKAIKEMLAGAARNLNFNAYSDARSLFRYHMHALPSEISDSIGGSTLFAAWNAAAYVGQIEDARLEDVMGERRYLEVTGQILQKHGGLWFWDESYVISRRRD